MGYSANADLQDLFDVGPAERAARRITERSGEKLTEEATERSPVAEPPAGAIALGEVDEWLKARKRKPGTLKESWKTSDVEEGFSPRFAAGTVERFSIESYTEDPIAPHVEWDTRPHRIVAVNAPVLRFWDEAGKVFRREVFHPGTRGQHMMRDSLVELEVDWRTIGEEEVARWAREQARLVR